MLCNQHVIIEPYHALSIKMEVRLSNDLLGIDSRGQYQVENTSRRQLVVLEEVSYIERMVTICIGFTIQTIFSSYNIPKVTASTIPQVLISDRTCSNLFRDFSTSR